MTPEMFEDKSMEKRIGKSLSKSPSLHILKEVEKHFIEEMEKYPTELAYDVMAQEPPFFRTVNYTEYAGCFMMHPLQQDLRTYQMIDARSDPCKAKDWVSYFKNNIKNKYNEVVPVEIDRNINHLIVLPGSNKLKEHVCLNKLKRIRYEYGTKTIFKPHPITNAELMKELKGILGNVVIADRLDDVYQLMHMVDNVHTTHISETAMIAACFDKNIDPIDDAPSRERGSFYHVNHFMFMEDDKKAWINKTFSSPYSGIVHPEMDKNWREKINVYLEYIHRKREAQRDYYVF